MSKLPPPPPRPRLDSYVFERSSGPQNGPTSPHTTENDCHRGWSVFSSTVDRGMPRPPASVDNVRPCRPDSQSPPPTPPTLSSRQHRRSRRHHAPSPCDKAACARFRLARKKQSATPCTTLSAIRNTKPTVASPLHPSLLWWRCTLEWMTVLANVFVRCFLAVVTCGIQRVYGGALRSARCPLSLMYDYSKTTPALSICQALSAGLQCFHRRPTRAVASPRRRRRSQPPQAHHHYLWRVLGGYLVLALCCLLVRSFGSRFLSPSLEADQQDMPVFVLDLDVVNVDALRDANPDYEFFFLPL